MSKRYQLDSSFWIPVEIDKVWPFASTPANLVKISPDHLKVSLDYEGEPYEGLEMNISFALAFLPFKLNWLSRIVEYQPKGELRHFVDTQEKGPFKYWRHTHLFKSGVKDIKENDSDKIVRSLNPGTWVIDKVEYEIPFGMVGRIGHKILINYILTSMFKDRKKAIKEHFGLS